MQAPCSEEMNDSKNTAAPAGQRGRAAQGMRFVLLQDTEALTDLQTHSTNQALLPFPPKQGYSPANAFLQSWAAPFPARLEGTEAGRDEKENLQ